MSSAYSDLQALCPYVEDRAQEALMILGGNAGGQYFGARLWLRYWQKKRLERLLFEIRDEASLIRRTSVTW